MTKIIMCCDKKISINGIDVIEFTEDQVVDAKIELINVLDEEDYDLEILEDTESDPDLD